jgi:hypothetical protein
MGLQMNCPSTLRRLPKKGEVSKYIKSRKEEPKSEGEHGIAKENYQIGRNKVNNESHGYRDIGNSGQEDKSMMEHIGHNNSRTTRFPFPFDRTGRFGRRFKIIRFVRCLPIKGHDLVGGNIHKFTWERSVRK